MVDYIADASNTFFKLDDGKRRLNSIQVSKSIGRDYFKIY